MCKKNAHTRTKKTARLAAEIGDIRKMKTPVNLKHPIFLILIGFLIGSVVISIAFIYLINIEKVKLSNETREGNWLEANKFLTISRSIKNKKYNEALSFSEYMLNLSLIEITNNGMKTSDFTDKELYILKEIKSYKQKECSLECMERLSGKYK